MKSVEVGILTFGCFLLLLGFFVFFFQVFLYISFIMFYRQPHYLVLQCACEQSTEASRARFLKGLLKDLALTMH